MAAAKKNNIMSLAMEEDMQNFLKKHAKATNTSVSKLIRDLVSTHLMQEKKITVIHHDPEYVPIVLKVPASLKGDREGLLGWLRVRTIGIAERLAAAVQPDTPHDTPGSRPN